MNLVGLNLAKIINDPAALHWDVLSKEVITLSYDFLTQNMPAYS